MAVVTLKLQSDLARAKTALIQAMNAATSLEGIDLAMLTELRIGLVDGGMTAEQAIDDLRESLWRLKQDIVAQRRGYREF